MAENETEKKETQQEESVFSSFLSKAKEIGNTVATKASEVATKVSDTAKEQYEKGKDFVEDKMREREADEIFCKLGKKVYKLVCRDEMKVPEVCDKYIEALDELFKDENKEECCCEDKKEECCCCEDKKEECCCCEDKKEECYCCEDKKEDCCCEDQKEDCSEAVEEEKKD